jgi:SAM-dependent methyltransferase
MNTHLLPSLLRKTRYALAHPDYLWRRLTDPLFSATNYDYEQWARVVMYRELFAEVDKLGPDNISALEVSAGGSSSPWRKFGFAEYAATEYPQFDICRDKMEMQFDLIIADQVFEHLHWPYRAARNVFAMLRPGGYFINTTPFLIRIHDVPVDCSRWTELGIKYLLAEAGFELDNIRTGSWGNLACVRANLAARAWARVGWGKPMHNEPDYPIAVWAIAKKQNLLASSTADGFDEH